MLTSTAIEGVRGVFYGNTRLMKTKWPELQNLENETFLNIIVGDSPLSDFDVFVAKWKSMGGEEITEEVAEIVKQK